MTAASPTVETHTQSIGGKSVASAMDAREDDTFVKNVMIDSGV